MRAIGISTAWEKLLENICNQRLTHWASKAKTILKEQYGFTEGKGAIGMLEDIFNSLQSINGEDRITKKLISKIDMKGTFDNVQQKEIIRS